MRRVWIRLTLGCMTCLAVITIQQLNLVAQEPPAITFEQLLSYVELEVKEEKLLRMLANSPTKFTLGDEQISRLKSAGASDQLLAAVSGSTVGRLAQSSDIRDFVIVLDASASMKDAAEGGQTKWEAAKQAANDLIDAIPNQRRLAFIVYGHDLSMRCQAVEVLRPLLAIDERSKLQLVNEIQSLSPSADTPIAASLSLARSLVTGSQELTKVILITDGMESCHGNPVQEAASLASLPHVQGGVDVIGLGLKSHEISEVEKIARSGRGRFFNAHNLEALHTSVAKMEQTMTRLVATEPVASTQLAFTKSTARPSKEPSSPAAIELRQYASGRLASGKGHYWTINLPAGEYVAICEASPSEGTSTNVIFRVSLDGEEILEVNEIDRVERGAAKFRSTGGQHNFTIENSASVMADYDFVICPADIEISPSRIKKPGKKIRTVAIGSSLPVRLDPSSTDTYEEYFQITLPEGDYELAVSFNSPQATGNYGAYLDQVNLLGVKETQVGRSYDSARSQSIKSKLLVADEATWYLRLRTYEGHPPIEGTVSLKPLSSSEPN